MNWYRLQHRCAGGPPKRRRSGRGFALRGRWRLPAQGPGRLKGPQKGRRRSPPVRRPGPRPKRRWWCVASSWQVQSFQSSRGKGWVNKKHALRIGNPCRVPGVLVVSVMQRGCIAGQAADHVPDGVDGGGGGARGAEGASCGVGRGGVGSGCGAGSGGACSS